MSALEQSLIRFVATIRGRIRVSVLLAGFLFGCVQPVLAGEVHLAVAASLKEAVGELSDLYVQRQPGTTFVMNAGASGVLAKQIENGAPTDLFFSASPEWVDYLKGKGGVRGETIFPFAYNTLVFVGRPGRKVSGMADLPTLERIAIGSPASVPAGAYASEALKRAGIENVLQKKLVLARDVRECLLYVNRGEVDGAFVYRTDVLQAGGEARILFAVPQSLYARITCPVVLTTAGGKNGAALAFHDFLKSREARTALVQRGFAGE
ncbi:MAG: molybdate ABC transporter substrate-binding protein [Deltaproteobacteria bacterium]|nr:molybdate ABC transporter substrate-binding protein [Deltaproteobacteria bacterium]